MKTACLSLVVVLALSQHACGQVTLEFGPNFGTFEMGDLKSFCSEIKSQTSLQGEMTSSFPAYFGFQGAVGFKVKPRVKTGIFFMSNSTGARYSYSDYSGSYNFDMLLQSIATGAFLEKDITGSEESKLRLSFLLKAGAIFTTCRAKTTIISGTSTVFSQNVKFTGTSLTVNPGFALAYPLSSTIGIKAELGYLFDTKGDLKDSDGFYLYLKNNYKARSDWSGLRTALNVYITLGAQKVNIHEN